MAATMGEYQSSVAHPRRTKSGPACFFLMSYSSKKATAHHRTPPHIALICRARHLPFGVRLASQAGTLGQSYAAGIDGDTHQCHFFFRKSTWVSEGIACRVTAIDIRLRFLQSLLHLRCLIEVWSVDNQPSLAKSNPSTAKHGISTPFSSKSASGAWLQWFSRV